MVSFVFIVLIDLLAEQRYRVPNEEMRDMLGQLAIDSCQSQETDKLHKTVFRYTRTHLHPPSPAKAARHGLVEYRYSLLQEERCSNPPNHSVTWGL